MLKFTELLKPINGVIYHVSKELASFDLYTSDSEIVNYYGLADDYRAIYICFSNGDSLLYKKVRQRMIFNLQTGTSIEEVVKKLNKRTSRPAKVDWFIKKASAVDVCNLIESMRYFIVINNGAYATHDPQYFQDNPKFEEFMFQLDYTDYMPAKHVSPPDLFDDEN